MTRVYSGTLAKLKSTLDSPVQYQLIVGETAVDLNPLLNKQIQLCYEGGIYCIQCQRKTNKSFQQGYCFPCMQRLNECGNCAIFPEKCKVESGACPKDDWAHRQCDAKQIVYLANTSGLKVGITRESHVPTRWIDQGAIQAMPLFFASNRYRAGLIEVAFKSFVADKTNWRAMLTNTVEPVDLSVESERLLSEVKSSLESFMSDKAHPIEIILESQPISIEYPVLEYPKKVISLSLDKTPEVSGVLLGIKGQYLLLDTGVINIRKFGGYHVTFSCS